MNRQHCMCLKSLQQNLQNILAGWKCQRMSWKIGWVAHLIICTLDICYPQNGVVWRGQYIDLINNWALLRKSGVVKHEIVPQTTMQSLKSRFGYCSCSRYNFPWPYHWLQCKKSYPNAFLKKKLGKYIPSQQPEPCWIALFVQGRSHISAESKSLC